MTALAIVFAVVGASLSAVGVQLQAAGVRSVAHGDTLHLRGLGSLTSNRRWLAGLAVLSVCAVLQILALALAPVTVIAPIVVLALPMVAVLNARATAKPLDGLASAAIVASTGGVALFVALAAGAASPVAFPDDAVLQAAQIVLMFGVIGALRHGIVRCVSLAAGTGAAYGLVSVLVRDVTYTFQHGGVAAVSPLSATGLAVSFAAGSWLLQLAYASGPPDLVVGSQTVLNPLVATALGIGLLDETANAGGWRGLGLIAGGAVAVLGVAVLARYHPDAARRAGRTRSPRLPAGREPA
jgi:hypothetical protein